MDLEAMLKQRREFEAKVVSKAWADPAFKAALLEDPDNTLKAFLDSEGYNLPDDMPSFTYRVVEETIPELVLVLPSMPQDLQLTDEQLDNIAGGGACNGYYGVSDLE
jgi:hypothetical protein